MVVNVHHHHLLLLLLPFMLPATISWDNNSYLFVLVAGETDTFRGLRQQPRIPEYQPGDVSCSQSIVSTTSSCLGKAFRKILFIR